MTQSKPFHPDNVSQMISFRMYGKKTHSEKTERKIYQYHLTTLNSKALFSSGENLVYYDM